MELAAVPHLTEERPESSQAIPVQAMNEVGPMGPNDFGDRNGSNYCSDRMENKAYNFHDEP